MTETNESTEAPLADVQAIVESRLARISRGILLLSLATAAVVVIVNVVAEGGLTRTMWAVVAAIPLLLGLLTLANRGSTRAATVGLVLLIYLIMIGVVITRGTMRVPATSLIILATALAGLVLGRGGMLAALAAGMLITGGLALAESAGLLGALAPGPLFSYWLSMAIFAVATGTIISYSRGIAEDALALARTEIAERRSAEHSLRDSEARFRNLTEMSADWYWEQDRDLRLSFHSGGFARVTGATPERLLGKRRWEDPGRVPLSGTWDEHRAKLEAHEPFRDFEYVRTGDDGTQFFVSLSGDPVFDATGEFTGYRGVGKNITERKRTEEAVRASQARFEALFQASPTPARIFRQGDGGTIDCNDAFCALYGLSREQLMDRTVGEFNLHVDSEARVRVLADIAARKRIDGAELEIVTTAGEHRTVLTYMLPIDWHGEQAYMVQVVDISARKQAEAERAQFEAQLRESQKMEAIGTLAGGIAHDFNNILATILGNTELARQDMSASPAALESLEEIRKAGSRARDLVQQILSFSRRQPTERKLIALGPVVEEAARLLRATLPARIDLAVHCAPSVPAVLADATQIQQIVINLATNAMQAIPSGPGHIAIRLDAVTLDAALADTHAALRVLREKRPGRMARLALCDDGAGIDASMQERIFEPFFTTKPMGLGTGLGLSVVHGIVQTHEGAIVVDSQPGKGSTFTLYLPAEYHLGFSAAQTEAGAAATTPVLSLDGGQHILYIDDDESLVFLVQRLLERRGYRISAHTDQIEALAALRAGPAAYDLVVTDYNMPGMSGLDVAREVRTIRADLPVAIASGFIDEDLQAQASQAGVRELIFKANTAEDLCEALARVAQTVAATSKRS